MDKIEKKWSYLIMFGIYLGIFFTLDYLNMKYLDMIAVYGFWLVLLNILLNLTMASLSVYLYALSSKNISNAKKSFVGRNMSELAVIFGILTYGCTPCVISFFAALSIPFATIALPFAGLPYKFASLLLIVIGIALVKRESSKGVCEINQENK